MHSNSIRNSPKSRLLSLSRLGTTSQSFKISKKTEASGHSKIVLLLREMILDHNSKISIEVA